MLVASACIDCGGEMLLITERAEKDRHWEQGCEVGKAQGVEEVKRGFL